ncbi:metallo-peptidase family m12 domain-containing protein [Trichoderma breve]|uniref:Metallo-peptidase family m12 domain-containing protein n=1 Tax=Trichoderma breve TaxID=2034170 RepID=A0A9W9E928_9HYPO|nr:metallo-peptidase family m12 domain-containing protein [Trichoderma breve]KAJ4862325.1 metallo-peptidase family m12 domain-containing protein [Trichoderma breve]
MSFTAIDDVNGNVDQNNCTLCMEALGPISDSDCRTLSARCHTPCRYHPSSQMEEGQGQGKELSLSTETVVITAGAFLRRATVPLHTTVAKYRCATETYGCTEVRVGQGDYISRWLKGSILTYTVDAESFPTIANATEVKEAMQKATDAWGDVWGKVDVSFKYLEVDYNGSATFVVRYSPGECETTYAMAFFPDALPRKSPAKLFVYELGLSKGAYLANIFAHEIGHIMGLRHEFADGKHREGRGFHCVLFGKKNPLSIMSYQEDLENLQVTAQDCSELKALYAYEGEKYKGLPIRDYDPILRQCISREETRCSHAMRKPGRKFSGRSALRKLDSFIFATFHDTKRATI